MCKLCDANIKNWANSSSKIKCAFDSNGDFTNDNWNCGTMSTLRHIAGYNVVRNGDDSISTLPLPNDNGFLIISWYKSRGRTETLYHFEDNNFNTATLDQVLSIINS